MFGDVLQTNTVVACLQIFVCNCCVFCCLGSKGAKSLGTRKQATPWRGTFFYVTQTEAIGYDTCIRVIWELNDSSLVFVCQLKRMLKLPSWKFKLMLSMLQRTQTCSRYKNWLRPTLDWNLTRHTGTVQCDWCGRAPVVWVSQWGMPTVGCCIVFIFYNKSSCTRTGMSPWPGCSWDCKL